MTTLDRVLDDRPYHYYDVADRATLCHRWALDVDLIQRKVRGFKQPLANALPMFVVLDKKSSPLFDPKDVLPCPRCHEEMENWCNRFQNVLRGLKKMSTFL